MKQSADSIGFDVRFDKFKLDTKGKRMFDVDVYKESGREDSGKVKTLIVKNITCS